MPVISEASKPAAPLRRLSRLQYNNTVHDLLGDTTKPAERFQAEEVLGTFSGSAALARVSPIAADQYRTAAETLAANAVKNLSALVSCKPTDATTEEACAKTFITDFGLRAYRRPLADDEITGKLEVFRKVRALGDFSFGIQGVLAALLQSPHFLYRPELTAPGSTVGSVVGLGPYQIASRLSYFLLNTMPDQDLFTAAKENRLTSLEDIDAQARRLLKDPRARESVGQFFGEWLILGALDDMTKDAHAVSRFQRHPQGGDERGDSSVHHVDRARRRCSPQYAADLFAVVHQCAARQAVWRDCGRRLRSGDVGPDAALGPFDPSKLAHPYRAR